MNLFIRPGLLLIKTMIQSELGYKIPHYTMILNALKQEVFFDVPNKEGKNIRHPYKDKKGLMLKVASYASKELKENDRLDVVIVHYPEKGDPECKIFYTDSLGNKNTNIINL